jgi:hypothetical protein
LAKLELLSAGSFPGSTLSFLTIRRRRFLHA